MNTKHLSLILFLLLSLAGNLLTRAGQSGTPPASPAPTSLPEATATAAIYLPPGCQGQPLATSRPRPRPPNPPRAWAPIHS